MTTSSTYAPPKRGLAALLLAAILVIAAVSVFVLQRHGAAQPEDDAGRVFVARRGPLTINVTESGTVRPRDNVTIKSTVEGTTTILSLVPEGTRVKTDDLLIELDASKLEEQKFDHDIKVQNAEATYIRAREDLEITKSQAQSDIETAGLTLDFAKRDQVKYVEGEYPQQLKEAETKITLAEEDLKRASEKLEWSKVLYEEKYISQTELQADDLAVRKAKLDLELARGNLRLLTEYTHSRTLVELNSNVTQAKMALDRTERKTKANIVQAEAELSARESEYRRQEDKQIDIREQILATRIVAPTNGQVVYATSVRSSHHSRGNTEPLEEGQQVHERQDLIYLPATDRMMAVTKTHESNLQKITVDMPARITMDALPGTELAGRVDRIAPLPNPGSFWMNPDLKVYDTHVHIEEDCPELRSGMNCKVDTIVAHYTNAVYVPVQCVIRIAGKPTLFVAKKGGEFEERVVETGLDNNRMIRIVKGLEEGERVSLTPPLDRAELLEVAQAKEPQAPPSTGGRPRAAPSGMGGRPTGGKTGGATGPRRPPGGMGNSPAQRKPGAGKNGKRPQTAPRGEGRPPSGSAQGKNP